MANKRKMAEPQHAGSQERQRQAGSPATQPPPRGIQAEPDSLLGVFKLSRPTAQPAHPHSQIPWEGEGLDEKERG